MKKLHASTIFLKVMYSFAVNLKNLVSRLLVLILSLKAISNRAIFNLQKAKACSTMNKRPFSKLKMEMCTDL